jgi:transketolase
MSKTSMRVEYGKCLVEAGRNNKNIIALDADLKDSTQSIQFERAFPERFIDVGVAEQNMVGIAAGLSLSGKLPIVHSFATFISLRACEQVRTTIAYPNLNVKFVVSHGGISCGSAGTTHHSTEDIGVLRTIPNLTILVPCDRLEAKQALDEALRIKGPVYIRLSASEVEDIYNSETQFTIGKGTVLNDGNDATVITTGTLAHEGLLAVKILKEKFGLNVRLLHMASIKPIDVEAIEKAAHETKKIVTVEEHSIIGGLGSAVSEIVAELGKGKVKRMGINDRFCGVGTACHLMEEEGLTTGNIVENILNLIR